jgi:phenylacetate-CoA ligase
MLIVRGVNLFPTQIEEQILKFPALTGHYQLVLTREGRMDEVAVLVEARADAWGGGALDPHAAELARRIKDTIGLTVRIDIGAPGSVERSQGKARRVMDNRPKD